MRVPSGSTDRKMPFIARDADGNRLTGLSSFTVYRSRNGGSATAYTTPTVAEVSSANMPGYYTLLLDEDTTVDSGHDFEPYVVHITCSGMQAVTRELELERVKFTEGQSAIMANSAVDADVERWEGVVPNALISGRVHSTPAAVSGTADSGTTTTMVDAALTQADTDYWKGCWIRFLSGNLAGQVRYITGFNASTDTVTFTPATTQAVATQDYEILPAGEVDLAQWLASTPNALVSGRVDVSVGAMASNVLTASAIAADAITAAKIADGAIDAATFAAGAIDAAAIADNAIDAGAIASNAITANKIAANAITSAKIATDAIGAAQLAADAVTEIRSVFSGTADSGTATTITDAELTQSLTDHWRGSVLLFTNGTKQGQVRMITAFNAATDTITFAPAVTSLVGSGDTYEILPAGPANLELWRQDQPNSLVSSRVDATVGAMQANVLTASAIASNAITSAKLAANCITSSQLATDCITASQLAASCIGASELAANCIGAGQIADAALTASKFDIGAIDSDVLADGAITSTKFAADAITSSALATDVLQARHVADATTSKLRSASLESGFGGSALRSADSGTTTTLVDAALTQADTDFWKGNLIIFRSGNLNGQVRKITAFDPATDTLTFAPATTQAVSTHTYEIVPAGAVDVRQWNGAAVNDLVSGRVDSRTGAMATDVLDAAALKADAVAEIQAGLATSSALANVQADTDDIQSKIGAPAGASVSADIAAVKSETASIQADTNDIQSRLPAALVGGRMDSSVGSMATNVLTAAALAADAVDEIVDANWDEVLGGHLTAGTTGKALSDASSGGSAPTAGQIADAVWDEDLAAHTTAGTGGANVGLRLDAAVSTRATPAQVNAEVLDVVATDTFAEPGQGAPPATTSILARLQYLYKFLRNKVTQTSTEFKVFADDATTVDHKATVSDDGTTFTRGKVGSGP